MEPGVDVDPPVVNPWLVAISVMFGTFMVVLDTTVVNVSLPNIAGNLSATVEESTWALTSYLAANAVILPITGWLANYFGRKRLLLMSVTGFTTASFMCGLSPSLSVLIIWRIIQGATGGVMQPLSQAVLLEAFPPRDRGKAMAFWGIGVVVAPVLGPVLGGWITDNYTWRWVFYINVPVGLVAFTMTQLFIFDPPYIKRGSARIDYWGIGLLAVGIGALQIALDQGEKEDWFASDWITTLMAMAAIALVVLVIHELRAKHPVVDLRIFRERTYAVGVMLITLMGFVLYASLVLVPILLQTVLGYPPLQAGIAMAPRGLGSLIAMPLVGIMMTKVDPRKLLVAGFATGAVTFYWLAGLNLDAGYWEIFWPQLIQGMGLGLLFVPLTTTTMDPIPKEAMGNATSLFNVTRNIGGSIGIATISTILARQRQIHTNILVAHVTPYNMATQRMVDGLTSAFVARGSDVATATARAYQALFGMVQRQAAMLSFLYAFRLLGLIFLLIAPLAMLMRRPVAGGHPPAAPAD